MTTDCREDCNVPGGRCQPKHVDCSLSWEEQRDRESEMGDQMYHWLEDERALEMFDGKE